MTKIATTPVQHQLTFLWRARVLCYYLLLAMVTIIHFIPMVTIVALGANYQWRYHIAFSYSWSFITLTKYICGIDYQVTGLENLPDTTSVVLSNHQSFWENMLMPQLFPKQSWVLKQELYNIPLFGWGLRWMDPIAINRSDNLSVAHILDKGSKKLAEGLWVVVFPEATRVKVGRNVKLKPSGIKLALDNKVPMVIMAHNAGLFWPKGFWIEKSGTIQVRIGPVIYPTGTENIRDLTNEVETILNQQKQELIPHYD